MTCVVACSEGGEVGEADKATIFGSCGSELLGLDTSSGSMLRLGPEAYLLHLYLGLWKTVRSYLVHKIKNLYPGEPSPPSTFRFLVWTISWGPSMAAELAGTSSRLLGFPIGLICGRIQSLASLEQCQFKQVKQNRTGRHSQDLIT